MATDYTLQIGRGFPGETIRSIAARFSLRSGVSPKDLLRVISHRDRIRLHPVLPCFLGGVAACSDDAAETLLRNHTLFPLYAFFLDDARKEKLHAAMFGTWPESVAQLARWSANQLCFPYVEKFCPNCVSDDILQFGVSYWHVEHQIPMVSVCWKHGVELTSQPLPTSGWDRFNRIPFDQTARYGRQCDLSFSRFATLMLYCTVSRSRAVSLDQLYRKQLARLQLLTPRGGVRRQMLERRLGSYIADSDAMLAPRFLPKLRNYCELVRADRCYQQHLITHLLFSHVFFERPERLFTNCAPVVHDEGKTLGGGSEKYLVQIEKGQSLNSISVKTGRSRSYLKRLAKLSGIQIVERPRILTPQRRAAVVELAEAGNEISAIAEKLGISITLVQSVVGSVPGLKAKRRSLKFSILRDKHQEKLRAFLRENQGCLRSCFQKGEPNSYYWLYRHEKDWLFAHLPPPKKVIPPARLDWRKRDEAICSKLKARFKAGWKPVTWSDVDAEYGCHGWFVRAREKLPKSCASIVQRNPTLDFEGR